MSEILKEDWKEIQGYEGIYWISNHGRIKNKYKIRPKYKRRNGYETISLSKEGKNITAKIHRLVAGAFIKRGEGLNIINHKDSNRSNNHVSNLEWCDHSHNLKHAYDNGNKKSALRKYDDINCITYYTIIGKYGYKKSNEYMSSGSSSPYRLPHLLDVFSSAKIGRNNFIKRKTPATYQYFLNKLKNERG